MVLFCYKYRVNARKAGQWACHIVLHGWSKTRRLWSSVQYEQYTYLEKHLVLHYFVIHTWILANILETVQFLPFRWFKLGKNPATGVEDWNYLGGFWDADRSACDLDIFWDLNLKKITPNSVIHVDGSYLEDDVSRFLFFWAFADDVKMKPSYSSEQSNLIFFFDSWFTVCNWSRCYPGDVFRTRVRRLARVSSADLWCFMLFSNLSYSPKNCQLFLWTYVVLLKIS